MIELYEQFGYSDKNQNVKGLDESAMAILRDKGNMSLYFKQGKAGSLKYNEKLCVDYQYDDDKFLFKTSYFVGVDWFVENKLPIYVRPKLNSELYEVDYLKMLFEALEESENFQHLDDLLYVDLSRPYIQVSSIQDKLTPFLIIQYLQLLKRIVRKGLKKSYYSVTENLNAKIKGKILVSTTIKHNVVQGKRTSNVCHLQEFGVNCDENKILKKAYLYARNVLQNYKMETVSDPVNEIIDFIHPAFEQVTDDISVLKVKNFKPNPIYSEYKQAIKLALMILKRFSYNISQTGESHIMTPPFWIDMSRLFELYVFSQLRSLFPGKYEIQYHIGVIQNQEIDFLIKSNDEKYIFVVDTKYKPAYYDHMVSIDDIRQLCGYARIKNIYQHLGLNGNCDSILKCLIIYSHLDCDEKLTLKHFEVRDESEFRMMRPEKDYIEFYKLGIRLPEIK